MVHLYMPAVSISIHPSRVGWDGAGWQLDDWSYGFQSTHPVWDGTIGLALLIFPGLFQSTHPVWDGTHLLFLLFLLQIISIHPSRVGWDSPDALTQDISLHISIHPSRVGWDVA